MNSASYYPLFCNTARLYRFVFAFMALPAIGCGTFVPYTSKINPLIEEVKSQQFDHTLATLDRGREGRDKILYLLERGRVAQIRNDIDTSLADYEAAINAVSEEEDGAVIRASEVGNQALSLLTNESAIPYKGEGYEKVFMYQFQAFNYLAKKDVEGAGVEVRRANLEQKLALERHEKEVTKAEEEAKEKNIDNSTSNDDVYSAFQVMDEVAGKVKNSFQNAYTFYMSGVVYELLDQPNDAYIDYKKALQIFPENIYLQRDVIRLAKELGMFEDYEEYTSRFENAFVGVAENRGGENSGELIIFFENGLVPQKQEIMIPLPNPFAPGILSVAFPIYNVDWSLVEPLSVYEGDYILGLTEPICHVRSLAVKALKEKIPTMAIKQVLRLASKGAIQKTAADQGGLAGSILSSLYNVISERADVRSWLTLPQDAQVMRINLPEGVHHITLVHDSSLTSLYNDVSINQDGKTILRVIRIGSAFYTNTIVF